MTQNKFWLVLSEENDEIKKENIFCSEAEATKGAYSASEKNNNVDYFVFEAKWHYKSTPVTVNKVNETQLHEKKAVLIETDIDATAEESLAVELTPTESLTPKFKVGDFVEYNKCKYEIHEIALNNDDSYLCGFKGFGYKYKDTDTGAYGWISESVISPWADESPKHDFKVGDLVEFESENSLKDTGTVIEVEDSHIAVQRKKCVSYFYDDEGVKLLRKL